MPVSVVANFSFTKKCKISQWAMLTNLVRAILKGFFKREIPFPFSDCQINVLDRQITYFADQ